MYQHAQSYFNLSIGVFFLLFFYDSVYCIYVLAYTSIRIIPSSLFHATHVSVFFDVRTRPNIVFSSTQIIRADEGTTSGIIARKIRRSRIFSLSRIHEKKKGMTINSLCCVFSLFLFFFAKRNVYLYFPRRCSISI